MPNLVLALDLSSSTGWAIGRSGEPARNGVWLLPKPYGARMSGLAGALGEMIDRERPDLVAMEAPLPPQAQTHMASARSQYGLAAVVEMICHECGVACMEATAPQVRMAVLGRARADKESIVDWAVAQGYAPATDDAADALMLLAYFHLYQTGRIIA